MRNATFEPGLTVLTKWVAPPTLLGRGFSPPLKRRKRNICTDLLDILSSMHEFFFLLVRGGKTSAKQGRLHLNCSSIGTGLMEPKPIVELHTI